MSWYEHGLAQDLAAAGYPVDALIMAAMLRADGVYLAQLRAAFPGLSNEIQDRQHSGGAR